MSSLAEVKKKLVVLFFVSLVYFFYAGLFLNPSRFNHFSLIDDGQVLIQSSSYFEDCLFRLRCQKFADQTFEFGTNRFRPTYWLINNFLYEALGNNAGLHHAFRIYVVGYLMIFSLALIFLNLKISWPALILGIFIFVSNYSFSENIIRLGTNEPLQVLFLAVFSLLYFRYKETNPKSPTIFPLLVILLIWTIFIKENSIAILPAVFINEYLSSKKNFRKTVVLVGLPFALFILGVILSKIMPSTISPDIPAYTNNYVTSPTVILKNASLNLELLLNSMSPFLKLTLVLSPLLVIIGRARKLLKNEKFYYWFLFAVFFTLILFPWRHVLERYQLVSIFGMTVVITFLIDRAIGFVKEIILSRIKLISRYPLLEIVSFGVVAILFLKGFPINLAKTVNFGNIFSTRSRFEVDQLQAIANYNSQKMYINGKNNIENWEFLYELPIHLEFLYGVTPNINLIKEQEIGKGGYIFSSSSIDYVVNREDLERKGYRVLVSGNYDVDLIDPIIFRAKFLSQPLGIITNPPLMGNGIKYYWEIRKL